MHKTILFPACLALAAPVLTHAAETTDAGPTLPPVVVTATRSEQSAFDVPGSIDSVKVNAGDTLGINPSEYLEGIVQLVPINASRLREIDHLDVGADGYWRCLAAVLLSGQHLDQLATACHQGTQRLRGCIGQWPNHGTHRIGEMGEHPGVDRIGLGQFANGFGEVTHLARVDRHHR